MAFADRIWDTSISSFDFDFLRSTLMIDSYSESLEGRQAHRLILRRISDLAIVDNTGGQPMAIAEIREFGLDVTRDGLLTIDINISDQVDVRAHCYEAVFDDVEFDQSALLWRRQ